MYYCLVDCNNFYASCERVFNPGLDDQAVVVLSNNDGCIIARSNEAKKLGIDMGAPYWKIRAELHKKSVQVFSSNYALYGDMSARVMDILTQYCADIEVYSIDEAFLKINPLKYDQQLMFRQIQGLRDHIFRSTGIPVSIGIAKTKTLAKLANHLAKKQKVAVYYLEPSNVILQSIPIKKVWGIAKAYARKLEAIGVDTVAQLIKVQEHWMKQQFGIVGLRLLKELKGFPCYGLEPIIRSRKNIMVSRSFRTDIYALEALIESISTYATRLAEKLRRYQQAATQITIFLQANPFREIGSSRRYFTQTMELPMATSCTNELISYAIKIVKGLYQKGINYKKSGILASKLIPQKNIPYNLFQPPEKQERLNKLMETMDTLNKKLGSNTLYFSTCGKPKETTWSRKEQFCSKKYTTKWDEILCINI